MSTNELWNRYREYLNVNASVGITVDISRMKFADNFFDEMAERMSNAFTQMDALERGEIVNPDENRMVGHYWLRDSSIAPADLRAEIDGTVAKMKQFASAVHSGEVKPEK